MKLTLSSLCLLLAIVSSPAMLPAAKLRLYVGTYTSGESEGIYLCEMDSETGALTRKGVTQDVVNPSFLAIHPTRKYLYAVNEIGNFQGEPSGAVSAFAMDADTGKLTLLNQQSSRGGAPCHLVVDEAGKNVLVANYTGGSIACLPIASDGRLRAASSTVQHKGSSVNRRRQEAPHAHSINLDDANRFAVVGDLGLDKILVYRFDGSKGTLIANDPPGIAVKPGAGPRHFSFHPNGRFGYVINELQRTVTALAYDANHGKFEVLQTISTLPPGAQPVGSTAEVRVHPNGKFLYGSNRGHDSIVVYRIHEDTGRLKYVENEATQGKTPRNFALDPTGKFLLAENQQSNSIVVFAVDQGTGALTPTGHTLEIPSPVCIRFVSGH